jgi:copper chaperone CopZ
METRTLFVPDISCEHCKHAIEEALGELVGVDIVKVDIPTKTVHIHPHGWS